MRAQAQGPASRKEAVSLQMLFQHLAGSSGSASLPLEDCARRLSVILGKYLAYPEARQSARGGGEGSGDVGSAAPPLVAGGAEGVTATALDGGVRDEFVERLQQESSRMEALEQMLRLIDRHGTHRLDFVQFARGFAVATEGERRGEEGGGGNGGGAAEAGGVKLDGGELESEERGVAYNPNGAPGGSRP